MLASVIWNGAIAAKMAAAAQGPKVGAPTGPAFIVSPASLRSWAPIPELVYWCICLDRMQWQRA